jgi:hypothetical protein
VGEESKKKKEEGRNEGREREGEREKLLLREEEEREMRWRGEFFYLSKKGFALLYEKKVSRSAIRGWDGPWKTFNDE